MSVVNLGLIQSKAYPTKEQSLKKHIALIRKAAAQGAQIICLQELFLTEYFCKGEATERFDLAEAIPGATTEALCPLAKELGVVIIASLFEKRGPGLYHNTAAVIDADGSYLGDLLRTASAGFQPEKEWAGITWRKVGTMEAHFDDGETGVLTYSVDGRQVMKRIWRQKFSDIVPACRYQP